MPEQGDPVEKLERWISEIHASMQRLLNLEDPMDPRRRSEELLKMSDQFLALSKTFLQMGQQATAAAGALMDSSGA